MAERQRFGICFRNGSGPSRNQCDGTQRQSVAMNRGGLRHAFATLALETRALDMHELSRAMGHASYAITDKVYPHVRPRDFSAHRAAFSAHISAGSTFAPVVALGG